MKGKDGDNMSGLDFERKHAEKRFEGSAGACVIFSVSHIPVPEAMAEATARDVPVGENAITYNFSVFITRVFYPTERFVRSISSRTIRIPKVLYLTRPFRRTIPTQRRPVPFGV